MRNNTFKYFLLFLLIAVFAVPKAFSQGKINISSKLDSKWQYDSNFYKSEENEKSVNTFSLKPGIDLSFKAGKTKTGLNYWFNILKYDDRDEIGTSEKEAEDFDYTEQSNFFYIKTKLGTRLDLSLDNKYMQTRDPANADATSNAIDRYKYVMNNLSPKLTYNFGDKFDAVVKYTNLLTDYSDDAAGEGEDSSESRGEFSLRYNLSPKTSFDITYQVWDKDYDKTSSDYDSKQVMANFKTMFHIFTVTAGAGYHEREFDKAVSSGDIYQPAWKLSLAGRYPPDAVDNPKSSVNLALSSNLNDSGSGDTYYNSTRLDLKLTYLFRDKINCALKGWYQNSDYETSTREDDKWLASLSADYFFNDILSLSLESGFEKRESNFTAKDYENRSIAFSLKFRYDSGSK